MVSYTARESILSRNILASLTLALGQELQDHAYSSLCASQMVGFRFLFSEK